MLAVVIGYLLGSIPSGMIVARVYRNVDLTAYGSGRTGATNVLRTLGPGAAAVAFAADFLKGVIAVLLINLLVGVEPWLQLLATLAAVLGHTYSPFLRFRGGRGVVTGLGATAVAAPVLMLVAFAVGLTLVAITRYVSLGSVVGTMVGAILLIVQGIMVSQPAYIVWGVLVGGLIVVAHRDNIRRLMTGTERKLGERVAT
ncbi:MAG: glycerol-3-phosphate 1-O-acyltransferase PlsY [Chloroflexi bacterium]|nr:glycerol-3-phosphate 1-O-acyltransferase PlsY [Chloroflexota bacterium]